MTKSLKKVVIIIGPTSAGKTAAAMGAQDLLGGQSKAQLISADSAMIYKGLDIGTAKPTNDELAAYPHELVSILDPKEIYSAADFVRDADIQIADALAKGKTPIIVGGTMLYVKCFLDGIAKLPDADDTIRQTLVDELHSRGGQALHVELARIDPAAAANIHPNNHQRLLRGLEVVRLTGRSMSAQWADQAGSSAKERLNIETALLGILPTQRALLHERIEYRFDQMLGAGFLDEVRTLHSRSDLHEDLPSIRAVGYRQGWQFLAGEIDAQAMRDKAIVATRQLAKRQMTWMRQWPGLESCVTDQPEEVAKRAVEHLAFSN
jgi:tRNA dimethylallyltransferase